VFFGFAKKTHKVMYKRTHFHIKGWPGQPFLVNLTTSGFENKICAIDSACLARSGIFKIFQNHFKENLSISSGSVRLFSVQRIMKFCVRWKKLNRMLRKVRDM